MTVTFVGVRHHSPACAQLVAATVERLRPAYVLVEGPANVNDRLDELLLGHQLPVAVFTAYRDSGRFRSSWAPLCAYSPEWVALTAGRACGAEVRFMDLPAWHPAFSGRSNGYADAERRYARAVGHLLRTFAVDDQDALWDHLFEGAGEEAPEGAAAGEAVGGPGADAPSARWPAGLSAGLSARLSTYYDLLRGEARAGEEDTTREAYMARWVRAALARAGDRPVVVVCGGFHAPALRRLVQQPDPADPAPPLTVGPDTTPASATDPDGWPAVPEPPEGCAVDSFLVPFTFRRMDAFTGYQSGMPSPEYYQRLWESGPRAAADGLVRDVARALRRRGRPLSTADLVAARTQIEGLARLRGHREPLRTDVLDGLVSALVSEDLEQRLPWSAHGAPGSASHPVVQELVEVFRGERTGRLHPDTPTPPLVHDVTAQLARHGLDRTGSFDLELDLGDPVALERCRVLHRLRVLAVPGFQRHGGPSSGADLVTNERWRVAPSDQRLPRLIEAAGYGATLRDAASAMLREEVADAGEDLGALAQVLFDAALCGLTELSEETVRAVHSGVGGADDLGELGAVLTMVLGLWRHDRLLGTAGSPLLGAVVTAGVSRVLWLAEGLHGGPGLGPGGPGPGGPGPAEPADPSRLTALAATRDALLHGTRRLGLDRAAALGTARRISADATAPPDLRGAAFGLRWSLGDAALGGDGDPGVPGDPDRPPELAGPADPADPAEPDEPSEPDESSAPAEPGAPDDGTRRAGQLVAAVLRVTDPRVLGDWLTGLFALARTEVLAQDGAPVLRALDSAVADLPGDEFLAALPALRQAFGYFPPRERATIAQGLLDRRGLRGSGRSLTRQVAAPELAATGMALEERVTHLLTREGLGPAEPSTAQGAP